MHSINRRISQLVVIFCAGLCLASIATGGRRAQAGEVQEFTISSLAFANNEQIPLKFTCSGTNQSPPLAWRYMPPKTRSLVLIVRDPDAPSGEFIHWVVFDIPRDTDELKSGIGRSDPPAQGVNGFGRIGYDGPCPPPGRVHHYKFDLMALDATLDLKRGASAAEVEAKAAAHRLATAELTGEFAR
jgi:Raf kinase inhibitor-like YbhB/YbcL family protein